MATRLLNVVSGHFPGRVAGQCSPGGAGLLPCPAGPRKLLGCAWQDGWLPRRPFSTLPTGGVQSPGWFVGLAA